MTGAPARFTVGEALRWCGGSLRSGDAAGRCTGVSIDSRTVAPGALFVAVRGEHHDAHAFLPDVIAAGAAAVVVEKGRTRDGLGGGGELAEADCAVIEVADTTQALGLLGAGRRAAFDGPVVAITGSNGKTSTKEFTAGALAEEFRCLKTAGNLNNQYGLPLTLLELEAHHEVAVVELGTNHPGEIAALAEIARPTIGVVTNIGTAHIEFLGSREGIAAEKGALFEALPPAGFAIANAEDERVLAQTRRTRAPVWRFGRVPAAEVRAERVRSAGLAGYEFDLVTPRGRAPVSIASLAAVHVLNALAGAAAALCAGASVEAVARGLGAASRVSGRLEPVALPMGAWVLNDSYNANPQSMRAALDALAALRGRDRAFAVLGDMGELGQTAVPAHREVGRYAAETGVAAVFALGDFADAYAAGAREAGLDASVIHCVPDHAAAADALRDLLRPGDWVLLKGSRSMRMERVLAALRGAED